MNHPRRVRGAEWVLPLCWASGFPREGCDARGEKRPLCSIKYIHPEPGLWTASPGEIAEHSAVPLFHPHPQPLATFTAIRALNVSCHVWHSFNRACGKKQYWVHGWGGRAQEDGGRDGLQGGTGRQGDGCGWGLSLPMSSPLIWRPRIEPPINKSKSYLNTLPFSTDWGYGLHLSLPLISKARSPTTFSPLIELLFLECFHVFTDGITNNRSFGFLAY